MSEKEFIPYSSPIPIEGTGYSAQIGKSAIKETNWVVRLIKGKQVMETETFDELNSNKMIAFIMRTTDIPMLNPYKINQNVKILIQQADQGQPLTKKPTPTIPEPTTEDISPDTSSTPSAPSISVPPVTAVGKECTRCGSTIDANFLYCPYCALQLKRLSCPACNKDVRADYKLCPYCGIQLK